jgi:membrane protease YdiL (CAAX protease family)
MPAQTTNPLSDDERRAARCTALCWATGVVALGNAGHLLWGERETPSERYTVIKALGLVPLIAWALRGRELTVRGENELVDCIRLWPRQPARETLAGLVAGAGLAAPVLLSQLASASASPLAPPVLSLTFKPRALLMRLMISIPLTSVLLEELIFRGLLHRRIERAWSPMCAQISTNLLFGLWHLAVSLQVFTAPELVAARRLTRVVAVLTPVLGTLPAGLIFGWLARRYGTLWAPFIAHWLAATALLVRVRRPPAVH